MTVDQRTRRGEMPFLDHLEELRWRILWSALALATGALVGFLMVWRFELLKLLIRPVQPYLEGGALAYFSPADPFFVNLKLGVIVGLILALPVIAYQIWAFLSPALEVRERRVIVPSLYLGTLLFLCGVAMAYFIALPVSLDFFTGFESDALRANHEVNAYISFVVRLLLGFGVVFELPVVVMILTALGLIGPKGLRRKRRHAFVVITVVASLLSPGDVVVVTILMMVPLALLYELSIVLSGMIQRWKNEPEERTIGGADPPDGAVSAR